MSSIIMTVPLGLGRSKEIPSLRGRISDESLKAKRLKVMGSSNMGSFRVQAEGIT